MKAISPDPDRPTGVTRSGLLALVLAGAAATACASGFPCWRGWDGNGVALSGAQLVQDVSQARRLWKSEWLPGVYGAMIQSGNSGLIVADGKVFLIYQVPNDTVFDVTYARQMTDARTWGNRGAYVLEPSYAQAVADPSLREAFARKKFAVLADDVVHCLDAATGRTLWKSVFERKGMNPTKQGRGAFICAKCAPHSTPCHFGDRLFTIGSTGRLYGLSAADGEPLWESDLGGSFARLNAELESARLVGTLPGYGRSDMATGPTVADGVLVAYDDDQSLLGFDPETGKRLWATRGAFSKYHSSPIRWVWQGKEYVVAFGGKGTCLDPKTGRVLWSVDVPPAREPGTACAFGSYAIFGTTCFRISPEGATKLWTYASANKSDGMVFITPAIFGDWAVFAHGEVGVVELATGKVLARSPGVFASIGSSVVGGDGRVFKELGRDEGSALLMATIPPVDGRIATSTLPLPHYAMSTTPVYLDGRLYVRMQDHVACYDLTTPHGAEPTP
jgi:outer membrane protein assembly factor BamB